MLLAEYAFFVLSLIVSRCNDGYVGAGVLQARQEGYRMAQKITDRHRAGAECMSYEYNGFMAALALHKRLRPSCDSDKPEAALGRMLLNVALESALIHARNILCFFRANDSVEDVRACQFVTERPPDFNMEYLKGRSQELSKLLAHPSYSRGKLDHNWKVAKLESEITTAWAAFLGCLSQENPELRALFQTAAPTDSPIK